MHIGYLVERHGMVGITIHIIYVYVSYIKLSSWRHSAVDMITRNVLGDVLAHHRVGAFDKRSILCIYYARPTVSNVMDGAS